MFKYLVCLCLVGVAYAGSAGYNYASASEPLPQVLQAPHPAPVAAPVAVPIATPQYTDSAPQASVQRVQSAAPVVEYVKQFYYFNAPEEHFARQVQDLQPQTTQTVKKHLNVILIKAPENNGHEKALRQVVNNVVEETKTHIYVLNKEPNRAALKKTLVAQQTTHHSSKPEVHFVKYRTPAEAHQKQQQIVQQYGGGNIVSLGGASSASGAGGAGGSQIAATNVNRQYLAPPTNGYIPPRVFF